MRFLFLNQYFPPDPAPTGVLLRELADDLAGHGHAVDFVASRQSYRAVAQHRWRLIRELWALLRMLIDGWLSPRPDVVISASSPPCLLVVATLVAMGQRAKSVHWIMDLYPEIAVALGEVPMNALTRGIFRLMGFSYRRAAQVVALDEDMAQRVRRHGVVPAVIRPWVFESVLAQPQPFVEAQRPWTWIYSGNLGRAHEWETLLAAQAMIEQRDPEIRVAVPRWRTLLAGSPSARRTARPPAVRLAAVRGGDGITPGAAPLRGLCRDAVARS